MDLMLLGGNSSLNEYWIKDISSKLSDHYENTYPIIYDHWRENQKSLSIKRELNRLEQLTNKTVKYSLFAKSAGVVIGLKAIEKGIITPEKCFFVGCASDYSKSKKINLDILLPQFKMPKLFIQQTNDRYQSFQRLEETLSKMNIQNYKMIEIEGSDHIYEDTKKLTKYIKKFHIAN